MFGLWQIEVQGTGYFVLYLAIIFFGRLLWDYQEILDCIFRIIGALCARVTRIIRALSTIWNR